MSTRRKQNPQQPQPLRRRRGNPIQIGLSFGMSESQRRRQVLDLQESRLTSAQKQERDCQAREERQRQQRRQQSRSSSRPDEWYARVLVGAASPQDYLDARQSQAASTRLWQTLCRQCFLTPPRHNNSNNTIMEGVAPSLDVYCHDRAALVLAEAQHALSEGLWKTVSGSSSSSASSGSNRHNSRNNNSTVVVQMQRKHPNTYECTLPDSHPTGAFSKAQLFHMRAGTIVLCQCLDATDDITSGTIRNNNYGDHREKKDSRIMFLAAMTKTTMASAEQTKTFALLTGSTASAATGIPPIDIETLLMTSTKWRVTPLTSLVSEFRQLETLMQLCAGLGHSSDDGRHNTTSNSHTTQQPPPLLALEQALLGRGNPHQFDINQLPSKDLVEAHRQRLQNLHRRYPLWKLPDLNDVQTEAAINFLRAPVGSISLVQGPPGTGKTTFLISTICQYLHQSATIATSTTNEHEDSPLQTTNASTGRTLMVAAPTNKAVSVLASRFMTAVQDGSQDMKILLAGDSEKLMEDTCKIPTNRNNNCKSHNDSSRNVLSSLESIYVYNFLPNLNAELQSLQQQLKQALSLVQSSTANSESTNSTNTKSKKITVSTTLLRLLYQFVAIDGHWFKKQEGAQAKKLRALLFRYMAEEKPDQLKLHVESLQKDVPIFVKCVASLMGGSSQTFYQINSQLVRTADIIFCTLSASGSSIFKAQYQSEDHRMTIQALIVDEAAAATEPELAIPFHLKPEKLLAVGDPKQLPASVMSQKAKLHGLDKSLHERLMSPKCQHPFLMLKKQYRMVREISDFPSNQFYEGKLRNSGQVKSRSYVSPCPLLGDMKEPFLFQDTHGQEEQRHFSYCNKAEATAVLEWIHKLNAKAARRDPHWCLPDKVRIIACYKAQVDLINSMLRKYGYDKLGLAATTVDSSQGCEANLVIVSFVRTCHPSTGDKIDQMAARRVAGFLTDDRRLNVALTRAKYELICIGSASNMMANNAIDTLRTLALTAQERGCLQRAPAPAAIVVAGNVGVAATLCSADESLFVSPGSVSDKENATKRVRSKPPKAERRKRQKNNNN